MSIYRYSAVFGASASLAALGFLYMTFKVKESIQIREENEDKSLLESARSNVAHYDSQETTSTTTSTNTEESGKHPFLKFKMKLLFIFILDTRRRNCCLQICSSGPPRDALSGFRIIFREGPTRLALIFLLFNFACYIFAYNGTEGSHRFVYVKIPTQNETSVIYIFSHG